MNKLLTYSIYQYRNLLQYRFNTIMQIIASLTLILIQYSIWTYVKKYNAMDIDNIISYVLLVTILQLLLPIKLTTNFISSKILKGNLINYLNRPNSLIIITFFTTLGNFIYKIRFQVLPLLFIYCIFFYKLLFRLVNIEKIVTFIIVYFFSYIIAFLLGYIISLLSTIFIRINGISELISALLVIFGGGILPLDLYPQILIKISEFTPFYSIIYAPISTIVYNNSDKQLLFIIAMQIFWIIIFWIIKRILSEYVFKRLDIMGG